MADINRVVIQGRLTYDPSMKALTNGGNITTFKVASNQWSPNGEVTIFIKCVCFQGTATFIGDNAKKGDMVVVDGSLQQHEFETKDGVQSREIQILAQRVSLISTHRAGERKTDIEDNQQTDDIPF